MNRREANAEERWQERYDIEMTRQRILLAHLRARDKIFYRRKQRKIERAPLPSETTEEPESLPWRRNP